MSNSSFSTLPASASTSVKPFTVAIPDEDLQNMRSLLKLTPVAAACYENSLPEGDRRFGLSREWLLEAKTEWENSFDWRNHEKNINSFPQFTAPISDKTGEYIVHFAALFSKRKDAIPILLLHGWPGNYLEFLPMLELLRSKYTPETLPYHIIVPSLPGYAFSSPAPIDYDIKLEDAARIIDSLTTKTLGFADGYLAQGGDVGSRVARILCAEFPSCKAAHLNFCYMPEPANITATISPREQEYLQRLDKFKTYGLGYYMEHATRPSTIGLILSSNPLALLAWVGEKLLDWTDDPHPSIDTILLFTSLYWLTKCSTTNLYSYRQVLGPNATGHHSKQWHLKKPFGFSSFPKEAAPVPRAWIETTGNLIWYRENDAGGHFAALEQPQKLLQDVEEFAEVVKGEFTINV